jgi:hypothetical protein
MARAKGVVHLGKEGSDPLHPLCHRKLNKNDLMLDPRKDPPETADKARDEGILCVACDEVVTAYIQGFARGQESVLAQFQEATDSGPPGTFRGPQSGSIH